MSQDNAHVLYTKKVLCWSCRLAHLYTIIMMMMTPAIQWACIMLVSTPLSRREKGLAIPSFWWLDSSGSWTTNQIWGMWFFVSHWPAQYFSKCAMSQHRAVCKDTAGIDCRGGWWWQAMYILSLLHLISHQPECGKAWTCSVVIKSEWRCTREWPTPILKSQANNT